MPTVLITPEAFLNKPDVSYARMLREAGFEIRYPKNSIITRGLGSEAETIDELSGCAAIIAGGEHLTRQVIESSPSLRVIARAGVGFDRVDIAAATENSVAVTITPNSNHEAVAEHTLAMLFALTKNVALNDRTLRAGIWSQKLTAPVRGRTIGLIGLGRIGRSTAVRCVALGLKVLVFETYPDRDFVAKHGLTLVGMDDLLAQSDFVSLHCPLNDHTRGLCNAGFFSQMKPGSALINTARGGLVVETDLLEALQSGHLSGAGLDVFEQEPMSPTNPLIKLENVVLSPHLGGTDTRSSEDMGIENAAAIIKLSRNEWPDGAVVNADLRSRWKW